MEPAARRSQGNDATPMTSPQVPSIVLGTAPQTQRISRQDSADWPDDEEHDTLRIVTDADRTLKLDEHRIDINQVLDTLVDDELTPRGSKPLTDGGSDSHPLTAGGTNKLHEQVLEDLASRPQQSKATSRRIEPAPSSTPSMLLALLVAVLGIFLGVGLTILALLMSPGLVSLFDPPRGQHSRVVERSPSQETKAPAPSPASSEPDRIVAVEENRDDVAGEERREPEVVEESTATVVGEDSIPDELVLPIKFLPGQHRVDSHDADALRAIAKAMIATPRTRFDVVGYTLSSETPDRSSARSLASRRARVALDIIRALGPSKRRLTPRAARYQEPLLVDRPSEEPHESVILRVTRR